MGYEPVLLRNLGIENSTTLEVYRSRGGYAALDKALKMSPDDVREEVKAAELRGRGGAGFPAGVKWGFLPPDRDVTYLCVNADESEPPTFTNRVIMDADPHMLIEGTAIAAYAVSAKTAYIYIRIEYHETFHILQKAIDEAYAAGLLGKNIQGSGFDLDIYIHRGAGAYICGEETGLIESIEGKRGCPRIKPPYPAVEGLFGKPTVINNVETLCNVPFIIERGADWFKSIGYAGSFGPKLVSVSGPVNRPGCFECAMGITVHDLIYGDDFGRGMIDDKKVKCVYPGGLSMGCLTGDELDMKLDFTDPANYRLLGLGTASAVVVNEDTDIRLVMRNVARFFSSESCGQCTQCREGTTWMLKMCERIEQDRGRMEDLEILYETSSNMGMSPGLSICGLSDGAAFGIKTIIEKFREDLEAKINPKIKRGDDLRLTG